MDDQKSTYLDGSETFLHGFFCQNPNSLQIMQASSEQSQNWPVYYHLSPQRKALLDWFDFSIPEKNTDSQSQKSSLLEIGAGCGALTDLFCQKVDFVTALEPTINRSKIIELRHQNLITSNCLQVINCTLEEHFQNHSSKNKDENKPFKAPKKDNELSNQKKYDFITLIGVLEYLGYPAAQLQHFFKKLKSALLPQGKLIIAIENKLGLKYFNGFPEDHTGELFSGLENYPFHPRLNTYTRQELVDNLTQAGFENINFYYPFPDYKLPNFVLHQATFTKNSQLTPIYTQESIWGDGHQNYALTPTFNAASAGNALHQSQLTSDFAPSFLIIAEAASEKMPL